jgi:N-acetylglucosamine-6-sulfatase
MPTTRPRISPGWDRFFVLGGSSEGHYYANWFNDQGKKWVAGPDDYMTEVIQDQALDFIDERIKDGKQFFAYVAPHAPHCRATPPTYA